MIVLSNIVKRYAMGDEIVMALAGVDLLRSPAAVLPTVDQAGELARGPALLVEVGGGDELLQDA